MNEVRLIDANALKERLNELGWTVENGFDKRIYIDDIINNAPTVEPKLSDEQIEKITDLLETEWGYKGIREDVSRILRGEEE